MPEVVRVVGPPGAGKTLLIVSLIEELRTRGHRVATVVRRESLEASLVDEEAARQLDAGAQASVIVLSGGGRVTIERSMELPGLRDIVASVDPSVDLLLAEGFADAGYPAVAIVPSDSTPPAPDDDLLAVVASEDVQGAFARFGPGETNGLAALIEQRVLGEREEVTMELTVDERPVEAMGFVKEMIARPLFTMVEQLKGVGIPSSIRINLRRRRRE